MIRKVALGAVALATLHIAAAQNYSGDAYVVGARVLALGLTLEDTGQLPNSGGSLSTQLLDVTVPKLITADLLSADTVGQNASSCARCRSCKGIFA